MEIAYAGEAYESFQAAVGLICKSFDRSGVYYMVEITPAESDDPPFDGWLIGAAPPESEWGDEVQVIRCKDHDEIEPDGPVENVRVERIYIY